MITLDKIKRLKGQLFPTGRAFKMPPDSFFQKLRDGLAESEKRLIDDAKSVLDSIIPDNANFSESDATIWERRLGLITNTSVPLATRMASIRRKWNHPGGIKARQHYLYIQGQLQAAGFNVYVHENLSRINPASLAAGSLSQHGDFQHGGSQHGGLSGANIVANSLVNEDDQDFVYGFSRVFFIGGAYLGDYSEVSSARETEFRELILRMKPKNLVAYLFINYV
jgi:hypothetical protein